MAANGIHGIVMFRAGATGNVVHGNYVGTNAAGTAPLGNVWAASSSTAERTITASAPMATASTMPPRAT